jgi:hypothetical protein
MVILGDGLSCDATRSNEDGWLDLLSLDRPLHQARKAATEQLVPAGGTAATSSQS